MTRPVRPGKGRKFACGVPFCPERDLDENGFCAEHGGDLRAIMRRVASLHAPPKPTNFGCAGVTDRGKPCGRKPPNGSELCSYHQDQAKRRTRCAKCHATLFRNVVPCHGLGIRCYQCGHSPYPPPRPVFYRDKNILTLVRNITEKDETL